MSKIIDDNIKEKCKKCGRPKLFSDEYYENMSIMFGEDRRKIQNAHYWSSAMNLLSDYTLNENKIDNLDYLFNEDLKIIKQCVLVELGRLYESIEKLADSNSALFVLVTVTKNLCEYAKSLNNKLRVHDAEKIVRNKRMELIELFKKQ